MKRKVLALTVTLFAITAFCLSGCGNSASVSIEDYQWKVTTIQENESGNVVACSEDYTYLIPDAAEIEVSCTTNSKELTLTNQTGHQSYSGTYEEESSEPESITYSIAIGEDAGTAVCAWTTYQDGSKTPTFILSIGAYTLNFEGV